MDKIGKARTKESACNDQRTVGSPAGGLTSGPLWQEMTRQRSVPPSPAESEELENRALAIVKTGLEKFNASTLLSTLLHSLFNSILQKIVAGEVFRLLSVARDMAAFIGDDDVLKRIANEAGQFSAVTNERRVNPSRAPTPARHVQSQLEKIAVKARREAGIRFAEEALRLCLAQETDHPMDVAKVSRVLLNIRVDEKTANVGSLHARLARMRSMGFKQARAQGRGRPRAKAASDPGDSLQSPSAGQWNPDYSKLLRLWMCEALDAPSTAYQDEEITIAMSALSDVLLDAQKVKRLIDRICAADPQLAACVLDSE